MVAGDEAKIICYNKKICYIGKVRLQEFKMADPISFWILEDLRPNQASGSQQT